MTDATGELTVNKADAFRQPAVALLFCDPFIKEHCAAVRLDTNLLAGFAEYNVELPPIKTIDRIRITQRR